MYIYIYTEYGSDGLGLAFVIRVVLHLHPQFPWLMALFPREFVPKKIVRKTGNLPPVEVFDYWKLNSEVFFQ